MVEIEHIQDIEKDQPAKSSAKEQKLKDPVDANTETQDTEVSEATEHDKQIENSDNPCFRGLSIAEIHDSKYSYTKGLDNLKKIEKDINLGGRKHKYKYDDSDGDDMNFDRYIEGLPCLKKRIPTHGIGTGKFVKLHISICKNSWCSAQALMVRAYTAMRIIDMLESQGYRVQISAYADNEDPGYFNEEPIGFLGVEVITKKFEDPLIKGQILTAISPWFFRYWMFKFWNAKFKMNWGYEHSVRPMKKETTSDIYIQTGEALTDEDAELTIERISKLFNKEEQFQLLGGSVTILYGTINLRILDNLWKREPAQQK